MELLFIILGGLIFIYGIKIIVREFRIADDFEKSGEINNKEVSQEEWDKKLDKNNYMKAILGAALVLSGIFLIYLGYSS